MQSTAIFNLSPSLPLSKHRRLARSTTTNSRPDQAIFSAVSRRSDDPSVSPNVVLAAVPSLPRRSWSIRSPNLKLRPWSLGQTAFPAPETSRFETRATAVSESAGGNGKSGGLMKTLELGLLFALWYLFNIYFNIYNKQVLKAYNYPMTATLVQLVVGTGLILIMWIFNLYKRPKVSRAQLAAILPLAIVHTLGNLFTNMSLGKVSVSFTHTIKAMEPFFSVALSAMFLGEMPTLWTASSLLPIMGGVALASMTETSFNWAGFWSAMASNLTNQSRNVLSKKVMGDKEDSLDNITLFSIITIMSLFLMAPITYFSEGIKFTPAAIQAAGLDVKPIFIQTFLAALCFHAYQQVSYMILQSVSPVTHSVGNCVKRVVVIVSSVLFFKTPVSLINALGTGIALAGVFLYSRVKKLKPVLKPKTA